MGNSYKKRINELEEWRRVMKYLESEMTYAARILPECLKRTQGYTDAIMAELIQQCVENMDREGMSFEQAFHLAWKGYRIKSCLTREDEKILLDFATRIGKGDMAEQKKSFSFLYQQLEERIAREKIRSVQSGKLCRVLFSTMGLAVVLILY